VRALKSFSSRRINHFLNSPGTPVWQRNYYEHIVRIQAELDAIQGYIQENPLKWEIDQDNPVILPLHDGTPQEIPNGKK
jgi:REP element-mobilizing transposase RayT